tara:strand:+ start:1587 stop:2105 length:519 start_codon:yes stop_codon:yes gene_type:complete
MIKIIDNFFKEEDLILIQDFALTKAYYTPQFFENSKEKNKKNHYGNRWELQNKPELLELFKKQSELKFKIKINDINSCSGIDQRNLDHFKPHVDDVAGILNILIMISGPTAVTNGTVFYTENNERVELDIHVGFRENRAVMFPSDWWHSQHISKVPNLKRYTATLFIKDYEE